MYAVIAHPGDTLPSALPNIICGLLCFSFEGPMWLSKTCNLFAALGWILLMIIFIVSFQLTGFEGDDPLQTVFAPEHKPSVFLNPICFWIAEICFMSLCYRLWHTAVTNRVKYTYLKLIKIGEISPDMYT